MVVEQTGWTARALAQLLGIPPQTVASWIGLGLIMPLRAGRGRGGHTIGVSGLLELLAVVALREAGFSTGELRRAVEQLRTRPGQERPFVGLTLVVSGEAIAWMDDEELALRSVGALRQPGQRLLVLPVGARHEGFLRQLAPGRGGAGPAPLSEGGVAAHDT